MAGTVEKIADRQEIAAGYYIWNSVLGPYLDTDRAVEKIADQPDIAVGYSIRNTLT